MEAGTVRWQRRAARLEIVLDYVEAHLGGALDVELLARLAHLSPFHFHRLFSAHLGESVSAYVRRRTLERAARCLLLDGATVTDCAASTGYASPAAFTRAFHRHFGASPRRFANAAATLVAGYREYLPAGVGVRELPRLEVAAVRVPGAPADALPEAWARLEAGLRAGGLALAAHARFGLVDDSAVLTVPARRHYAACVELDGGPLATLPRRRLGGGSHAVFVYEGPLAGLPAAHEALAWLWSPGAGWQRRAGPMLHRLLAAPPVPVATAPIVAELFVPVAATRTPRARAGVELRQRSSL